MHQGQHAMRRPNGASHRGGYQRMETSALVVETSEVWFMLGRGRLLVILDILSTPLSTRRRTSLGAEAITMAKAWITGLIIRLSMLAHGQRILTGCPAAALTVATVSDTCFFISMGLSDGFLSTRRNRRNAPRLLPKFADCWRYTVLIARYSATLEPSSIRPVCWNWTAPLSQSSSTMGMGCLPLFCSRSVEWRHAGSH